MIVTTDEAGIKSNELFDALQNDGTKRNMMKINLRDVHNAVSGIAYDERPAFIAQNLGLNEQLLHVYITGQ